MQAGRLNAALHWIRAIARRAARGGAARGRAGRLSAKLKQAGLRFRGNPLLPHSPPPPRTRVAAQLLEHALERLRHGDGEAVERPRGVKQRHQPHARVAAAPGLAARLQRDPLDAD